jgi:hypothetical protein
MKERRELRMGGFSALTTRKVDQVRVVINMQTARELSIEMPPGVPAIADEMIE